MAVIIFAALVIIALGVARRSMRSMDAAEVVRRLAGMRTAMALFRLSKGAPPRDFYDIVKNGSLEAPLELKLKGHKRSSSVRPAADIESEDTGGWAYVNDPKSGNFGTIFIDCSHRDEKGRYWSEF